MSARGLLLLAVGRAEGIKLFANTVDAVTASLAPLIAFPLVMAALTAMQGQPAFGAVAFLSRLCAVLALPIVTYEAARLLRRPMFWMRTMAALNWSFWPMLVLLVGVQTGLAFSGLSENQAAPALGMTLIYLVWFQWFIVRAGLGFGRWAALALVLINDALVVGLSATPLLFIGFVHGKLV